MDYKEDKNDEESEINENIAKNQINEEDFYNEIRIIPYFVSEFGLFLIILFIVLLFFIIPQYHSGKLFHSKKLNIPFDTNYIPKILFHLTDIHVSHNLPKKFNGSFTFLTSFIEYKPDLILTTGDIVDNFEGDRSSSRVGSQWLEDWELYNKTVRNLISKYPVIDVAGNHDVWALDSATSKDNLFLDYSFMFNRENVKSEDDFIIKKIKMMDLTFILFNDYRFPNPHPPYGLDVHTSKHQLDLLENMIDSLEEEEECYILSHYNVERVWYIKSSKGNDFYDIISNRKVAGLFTGHEHPKKVNINHHGAEGGLEYCTSSPFNNQRSGLITIDNGNLIYHDTYIPSPDKRPLFFMTYPVPNDQVSSHHIFNLKNLEIRVLSYVTDRNVTLKIEGDLNDELKYVNTLKNGAILYSLKVNNMENGNYNIHVYDVKRELCDISRNFVVGDSYQGQREKAVKNHRAYLVFRLSSIPMLIFLFIIIFPYKFNKKIELIENIENYIEGKNHKYINTYLNEEVGKKGGVIFYITDMTDVEGITYTKREVLFNKTILGENNAIYKVGCSPWLYENFYIICEFDETIPRGKYTFNFNSSEDIFNYSGYEIHLQDDTRRGFQIQKLDLDKPDIYSDPQIINVTDDKENYELKYNIKSYNDEQIFFVIDLNIIPISIIPLECKRNNDELICPIKKTTLECYGTMINSGRMYYMYKDKYPERFYLIPKFQINFDVQKINVYINITKLLTKYLDRKNLIVYETNITNIPEVNVFLPDHIALFENQKVGECAFRKEENSSLLLLCLSRGEGIYSLKEIKNEIRITDINYKYNFIILPVVNNEKAIVSNNESNVPNILNINPKILDFNKIDLIQIDIIFINN